MPQISLDDLRIAYPDDTQITARWANKLVARLEQAISFSARSRVGKAVRTTSIFGGQSITDLTRPTLAFVGRIMKEGKNGEKDFEDARYWVLEQVGLGLGDEHSIEEPIDFLDLEEDPNAELSRWIPATNIAELPPPVDEGDPEPPQTHSVPFDVLVRVYRTAIQNSVNIRHRYFFEWKSGSASVLGKIVEVDIKLQLVLVDPMLPTSDPADWDNADFDSKARVCAWSGKWTLPAVGDPALLTLPSNSRRFIAFPVHVFGTEPIDGEGYSHCEPTEDETGIGIEQNCELPGSTLGDDELCSIEDVPPAQQMQSKSGTPTDRPDLRETKRDRRPRRIVVRKLIEPTEVITLSPTPSGGQPISTSGSGGSSFGGGR